MLKQLWYRWLKGVTLGVAAGVLLAAPSAAATQKVIHQFTGGNDGGDPASQLIFDHAGNAYGTTVVGGLYNCGTVFQLKPMPGGQWQQNVLYNFTCLNDGKNPYGGVTFDNAGNLYGTTAAGGLNNGCTGDGCGVVYKLTQSGGAWSESVLYTFTGGNDGYGPGDAVVLDTSGNLYGTTPDGGAYSAGVVYQLTNNHGQWQQKVIHAFTGGNDGAVGSLGSLLLDGKGNLYGVTELGGANSAGTVYKVSPAGNSWTFTTLYSFKGEPDAAFPYGGLIADSSGVLYGTTYYGGASGNGAVFALFPPASISSGWKEVVLYSFLGGSDGSNPTSTLTFDGAHNLYGTTTTGGDLSCGCGTVFQLKPVGVIGWKESILHAFVGSDGANPYYGLTPDGMGNYIGTTAAGGLYNQGVVYELTP